MIDAIDEARLAGAQMEHERMQRQARVAAAMIRGSMNRLSDLLNLERAGDRAELRALEGVAEHLEAGDWILSPTQAATAKETSA